ncbi:hypothetical protein pf16_83 [Pseudomonas phage pf16]|uniref:Uncharacterized protein n=1 Tax=Pseudomonas phage pf16 TaxID=1815630 RepID=A0A1S5R3V3_9CAUD|nr:hypothetical protein FDG98_gp215 [Pseudomonas phage pf16]AND75006.1 hypothetical protein pf16_83 [Pseudomonas phage pf16]
MKQITDNAERAEIVKNALAAIKLLQDMEKADLKAIQDGNKAQPAATPAKPAANAKSTTKAAAKQSNKPAGDGNTALLAKIDEYLATPAGKAAAGKAPSKPDDKGFRPRNGRMDIIRAVVNAMGVGTPTQELLDKVNEVSKQRGLKEINKTAFYTLVSEVRKELA